MMATQIVLETSVIFNKLTLPRAC